ncbi:MAG: ABC transporter permease subunit [Verrucomicrobiota bacterium JB023]|nr:ABC transporter permease subunit [Verrucomicrobiota bacterium JB023]
MAKILGWILMITAVLAGVGDWAQLRLPTVTGFFDWNRKFESLMMEMADYPGGSLPVVAWVINIAVWVAGAWLVATFSGNTKFSPITLRRFKRFREIGRGYWSLVILLILALLSALDFVVVGPDALMVKQDGKITWPAFTRELEKGSDYGLDSDELAEAPVDFLELKKQFKREDNGDWVIMPLLPYAPTNGGIVAIASPLNEEDGVLSDGRTRYNGYAYRVYDIDKPERRHLGYRYRDGLKDGRAEGWDEGGSKVYEATYREGVLESEVWTGEGTKEDFFAKETGALMRVDFNPAPPSMRHWLGTTTEGNDVLAYLYGGLQVNFQAALIYIPLVYFLGVNIGLLMGYFGGKFDLVVQRLIEVLSNVPFLFVVMIVATAVPTTLKETYGLVIICAILVAFGWMGMTYLMRTAAYKEKSRDYIAAAKSMGASTARILTKHLFPNSVAIVVTLVPFSVSGLVLALASLDYLGFGLPPDYATWGKLLREGLQNPTTAPWLVSSAFGALFILLILVTFVGEAVREAFDPKKYSYYK